MCQHKERHRLIRPSIVIITDTRRACYTYGVSAMCSRGVEDRFNDEKKVLNVLRERMFRKIIDKITITILSPW